VHARMLVYTYRKGILLFPVVKSLGGVRIPLRSVKTIKLMHRY
jgi:hypothetical protein